MKAGSSTSPNGILAPLPTASRSRIHTQNVHEDDTFQTGTTWQNIYTTLHHSVFTSLVSGNQNAPTSGSDNAAHSSSSSIFDPYAEPNTPSLIPSSLKNSCCLHSQPETPVVSVSVSFSTANVAASALDSKERASVGSTFVRTAVTGTGIESISSRKRPKVTMDDEGTQSSPVFGSLDTTRPSEQLHSKSFKIQVSEHSQEASTHTIPVQFLASVTGMSASAIPTSTWVQNIDSISNSYAAFFQSGEPIGTTEINEVYRYPLTKLALERFSDLTRTEDASQTPSVKENNLYPSTTLTCLDHDSTPSSVKQSGLGLCTEPELKVLRVISPSFYTRTGNSPAHGTYLTYSGTQRVTGTMDSTVDNTTLLNTFTTLTSQSINAQLTHPSTLEEGSSASKADGSSNLHSTKQNNVIISVGVISAAALIAILLFFLMQKKRGKQINKHSQLTRSEISRSYDPNCSYFSLDSTLDS